MNTPAGEEFTELRDADIPRVDLVDKAANGTRFLIAKQSGNGQTGLLDPALVRNLVAKAEPDADTNKEQVTMTGSPGAIARLIHEAAQRDVTKAIGGELDDAADEMNPTIVLAEAELKALGDMAEPGSPAWEAIDAATARKWTSIAVRLRNALSVLAERELLEAACADPDDAMQAMDLQDAQCALDYVIDVLAGFAVEEQAQAELCSEAMEMVGKALHSFDVAALDTVEALGQVAKAGRVLSAANESAIRAAAEHLQKVLTSLPEAPTAPVEKEAAEPVAEEKETSMPQPETSKETVAEHGEEPEMGIAKADGEKTPMVVVYDQKGRLIGIVDPGDVTPVANAEADADDMDDANPDDGDGSDGDGADGHADLAPQPPGEAGTPADAVPDDVTKHTTDTTSEMFKSSIQDMVKAVLDEHSATQNDEIAKTGDAVLELAELVETLKGQVRALEEQPAEPRVFTNGAVPPAHLMRGQDRGAAAQVDVTKARDMKRGLYGAADAGEQNRIATDMQSAAIARLQEIHQRRA